MGSGEAFGLGDSDLSRQFNRRARRTCNECGSASITWMSPTALVAAVPADGRMDAQQAAAYAGPDGEAWMCRQCGHWGVFGALETGL